MSARYALETFCTTVGGADYTVVQGARRDSADPVVTANPLAFGTLPPPGLTPQQLGYLAAYPGGPQV
jgi:hypothetical protein